MALYGGLVGAAPLGGSRGTHLPLLKTALQQKKPAALRMLPMSLRSGSSSFVDLGRLRFEAVELSNRGRLSGGALSVLSMETLRWVFTVSALFRYWPWRHPRRLCRGSGGFALLLLLMMCLPCGRGDYGLWTAFLVFLVRLFYSIPGELELPLLFLLLVIISPYQALNLRGTQAGMVISIAVAAYLALQHFSRAGGLKKALDQETVVPTVAAVLLVTVPLLFLIQGFIF